MSSARDFKVRDFREKGFFVIDDIYLNGYAKHLGVHATAVYLSLCRHADHSTQHCFPSQKLMAEETGMSERTVIRKMRKLEEWNIIRKITNRQEGGTYFNNTYYLLDKSEWKNKPSDTVAHGQPCDSDDTNHVTHSHTKETHIKETHIRLKSQPEEKKRKQFSFPKDDYKQVIDTYISIKGIQPQGDEYKPIFQSVKSMFMAGRTTEQVVASIKWVSEQDYNDWTIDTVKKKIPEILPKIGMHKPQVQQSEEDRKLVEMALSGGVSV